MSFYLKKYMWLINLVAVMLCAYFLAKMTTNLVALKFESPSAVALIPASSGKTAATELPPSLDYEPILKRNIFDAREIEAVTPSSDNATEPEEEAVVTDGEAVPTTLSIKLISTFSVGSGEDKRSSAVIEAGGGKGAQDIYTVNDEKEFSPQTKIVRILNRRVEFTNKGRLEYVELEEYADGPSMNVPPKHEGEAEPVRTKVKTEETAEIEQAGDGKFFIARSEVENAIQNMDKIYTQIRAVPYYSSGRANGLKLLSVRSDSIFAKLGLQKGDILQKINGLAIGIKEGLEIFNKLKNETEIIIELERGKTPTTLEYEIR